MRFFAKAWCVRRLAFVLLLAASGVSAAHSHSFLGLPGRASFVIAQSAFAGSSSGAQVIMMGIRFQPAELTVHVGETVEFKNEDIFAHTVTGDDGSFDSGLINPGSSWKMTMPKTASLAYHCRPHPNMKAKLLEASSDPPVGNKNSAGHGLPGFVPPLKPHELHPILVNFTAALLPLALLSDLLGRLLRRSSLHHAAAWMVLYAALITPLTGAAGWWWMGKVASALPPQLIAVHQWLGTSLVLVFSVLAVWRLRIHRRDEVPGGAYLTVATIVVMALIYQGSLGGSMVFGR
jgi:uncharacterized membrane protein/plastocyanin